MILSSQILTSIAKDLSTFKEAKRAKKLVFYLSQKYWENDFNIIDGYAWEDLLQSVYENNPTKNDLKAILYHAVNTLNRKNVYLKIAKYIFQKMSSLYNYSQQVLEEKNTESNRFSPELIDTIVENIEQNDESPRMKKLIFAACKKYWENDNTVIKCYDLQDLILELRQSYPTIRLLKNAFEKIISSINRQKLYFFIADTILGELSYLYQYETASGSHNLDNDDEEDTRLILGKKAQSASSDSQAEVLPIDKETEVMKKINLDQEDNSENITGTIEVNMPQEEIIPWSKIDNLFDLKQEIMQYANPLKAKIMLFYAIYQINPTEQHWSIVRTCNLDDLLINIFQHYGKNIGEIESNLTHIANLSLDDGLKPEDNLQTVSAIVEAIKHFYQKDQ